MIRKTEIERQIFDLCGNQPIEITDETEFEVPIVINGYTANNMRELHEFVECDVISVNKYDDIVEQLRMGKLGVKKQRKKYKELYQESQYTLAIVRGDYYKMAQLINEIDRINKDKQISELIDSWRE